MPLHGKSEPGDGYGTSLAAGDFDGNGVADLAIGIPMEDYEFVNRLNQHVEYLDIKDAGQVHIVYFDNTDPETTRIMADELISKPEVYGRYGAFNAQDDYWGEYTKQDEHYLESAARFGASLTTGDFNDDGVLDLAIGAPNEKRGNNVLGFVRDNAGEVYIAWGGSQGDGHTDVTSLDNTKLSNSSALANDLFGSSLTAGDFDNDGVDDLVVSEPGLEMGFVNAKTADMVFYGQVQNRQFYNNWSKPSNSTGAEVARDLGLYLNLQHENAYSMNERWIVGQSEDGHNRYYFILPNGEVRTHSNQRVATVPTWYYDDPERLINADKRMHVLGGSDRHELDRSIPKYEPTPSVAPTPQQVTPTGTTTSEIIQMLPQPLRLSMQEIVDAVLASHESDPLFPHYNGPITVGVSYGLSGGLLVSGGSEAGYWQTSEGDMGYFSGYSYGLAIDASIGSAFRVTVIRGDYTKLAGSSVATSVSVNLPLNLGVEATSLMDPRGGTIGYSFAASAGGGVDFIPLSISIERSMTTIHTDQYGWSSGTQVRERTCKGNIAWFETWEGEKFILSGGCE